MQYVFINPVTALMYSEKELTDQLNRAGYTPVSCNVVWRDVVRERYRQLIESDANIWADARCPRAVELVKKSGTNAIKVAPIEPILISCARELDERDDLRDDDIVITTPCGALADAGNALRLTHTSFMTWSEFSRRAQIELVPQALSSCPVPPGFFDELPCRVVSVTGSADINRLLDRVPEPDVRLIEMLYCPEGCHNGDGVWPDLNDLKATSTEER